MSMTEKDYDATFGYAWHVGADVKDRLTHAEYDGDPTGNLTPTHVGKICHDTANDDWYIAHGLAAADWKIFAT